MPSRHSTIKAKCVKLLGQSNVSRYISLQHEPDGYHSHEQRHWLQQLLCVAARAAHYILLPRNSVNLVTIETNSIKKNYIKFKVFLGDRTILLAITICCVLIPV